jgi:putative transcriptional regulator
MAEHTQQKSEGMNVGDELVGRLGRFTQKLDSISSAAELPEVLTVRKVKLNLRPQHFTGAELKAVRERLRVSQAVFAEFLGVSASTLRDWEQEVSSVSGPACRLLQEILHDFESWSRRIRELAEVTA